ncbi:MAG: methyltransferase family protein [Sulfurifustis sp.]
MELKIPPPILLVIAGVLMWLAARYAPNLAFVAPGAGAVGIVLMIAGIAVSVSGARAFHRVDTTKDPRHPERTTALVTGGIYRITRNPMYLGLALVLVGWGIFLSNVLSLLGVVVFLGYLNRFQIVPEERALEARFGEAYRQYKQTVRRWL